MATERNATREAIRNYWVNDGPKAVFMILFILANIAVFVTTWFEYMNKKAYFAVLSYGICVAKSSAAVIKLNSAVILIPVLRNFLSWLRGTWVNTYIPIDKNIVFHKFVAWVLAVATAAHCVAHFWNFQTLATTPVPILETIGLKAQPTVLYLSVMTIPGLTGYIGVFIMIAMYTSAIASVRRPNFELFWYIHHFFILYMAVIAVHGVAALFGAPTFWYWVIGPTFLYLVERTFRFMRGKQTTMLLLAKQHPSRVIELRMKKATFNYKPGQYLYLNCPYIAKNEWHPFTITSAPEEEFVSVHINIVGNWTGQLAGLLNPDKKLGIVQRDLLEGPDGSKILAIDGPFGTASEEVFKYKTVMLVGAGIGVTPFASILKHIRFQLQKEGQKTTLEKVYFYWVCRDKNSFEWISGILADLEQENVNNFLEIHTYLTGSLTPDEVLDVMYDKERQQDQITGLSSPTHFGRPKWKDIFAEMAKKHSGGSTVGVFFCGPRVMSKQLYYNCRRHTNADCKFKYHKENF